MPTISRIYRSTTSKLCFLKEEGSFRGWAVSHDKIANTIYSDLDPDLFDDEFLPREAALGAIWQWEKVIWMAVNEENIEVGDCLWLLDSSCPECKTRYPECAIHRIDRVAATVVLRRKCCGINPFQYESFLALSCWQWANGATLPDRLVPKVQRPSLPAAKQHLVEIFEVDLTHLPNQYAPDFDSTFAARCTEETDKCLSTVRKRKEWPLCCGDPLVVRTVATPMGNGTAELTIYLECKHKHLPL